MAKPRKLVPGMAVMIKDGRWAGERGLLTRTRFEKRTTQDSLLGQVIVKDKVAFVKLDRGLEEFSHPIESVIPAIDVTADEYAVFHTLVVARIEQEKVDEAVFQTRMAERDAERQLEWDKDAADWRDRAAFVDDRRTRNEEHRIYMEILVRGPEKDADYYRRCRVDIPEDGPFYHEDRVTCEAQTQSFGEHAKKATVNWSAMGTVSTDRARSYARAILAAADAADGALKHLIEEGM